MPFMLPTILKNLFTGYATRLYPVQIREPFENARGHIVFHDDKCTMCGTCALRCPSVAVTTDREKNELHFYPLRCLVCEVCVQSCPADAIELIYKWRPSLYDKPVELHKSTRLEHLRASAGKEKKKEVEKGSD
jgi:ech hydrogenase subunit F